MDLTLARGDYHELICHGLRPTELMQILAGSFPHGTMLVKHLEISEIEGIDARLEKGDFAHEVIAPGAYLFDAPVGVTFLANVHIRRGEVAVFAEFPPPGPARDALLGPKELWPEQVRAARAFFYAVTPNEDLVSIATTEEALARAVLAGTVKLRTLGRVTPDVFDGEDQLWDHLAPLAEEPALWIRTRRAEYAGEKRAVALSHASQWIRGVVRARLRARRLDYRHPATVTQREIIAYTSQNRIEVSPAKTVSLRDLLGPNRWLFDRFGAIYFFALLGVFLVALWPAATLFKTGPSAVGIAGVAVLCAASWAMYDMGSRD